MSNRVALAVVVIVALLVVAFVALYVTGSLGNAAVP